jgi:lipid-binding SYLF domain-containing protein
MKTFLGIGLTFALALPALAQDKESDRVENAGKVMQEIIDAPDSIPKSILDKTECVVILPSVLKFSFGLGSSYGRGVMTCRSGKSFHGSWSAPAMMALEGLAQDCSSAAIPRILFFSS